MKEHLKKSSRGIILLIAFILLFSCSSQDDNNKTENEEPLGKQTVQEESKVSDDLDDDEDVPNSEFTKKKMKIGSIYLKNSMDISTSINKEVMKILSEFNAVGIEKGAMLTLPENILFDFDSDKLLSKADDVIDQLKQVIDEVDGDITIIGHTDSKGEDTYNQKLSEDRANAVLEALVNEGIKKERIIAEGKGSTEPIAKNTKQDGSDNPDGRQKNRRVEVTVQGFNE